ncbi:hypothetical protein EC973_005243 [Apophysomyces ossiformis]|uniref:Uncharacterized protein n=1 Tax=Apophysomyces ossiformis TaxID=679940 RepID=A0A8H7BW43_9FUNG|nr:hypothetical protein EC973_005243 [Apophysomyces ossiformis]
MTKRVQFSCQVEFASTFDNEEYDRTAQEVAKLTYKDMAELLTMKSQWRKDMERMLAERAAKEQQQEEEEQDPFVYNANNNNPCEICT